MRELQGLNARKKVLRRLFNMASLSMVTCVAAAAPQLAAAQIATYALEGDMSPDGNGTFLFFSGSPTLNESGQVAFTAELTNTMSSSTDRLGIFLANGASVSQLVRSGESAPDGNGTFSQFSPISFGEPVALNNGGSVAFSATLGGTSGGAADNTGLFGADGVGPLKQFVRFGDAAPDANGVLAGLSPPGLDDMGRASFHGFFTGTTGGAGVDDTGAYRSDGLIVTQLARAGAAVPGGNGTFSSIDFELGSNPAGLVAIDAFLTGTLGGSGVDDDGIYVHDGAALSERARNGVPAPDGDGTLVALSSPVVANNDHVVFRGFVTGTAGGVEDGSRLLLADGVTLVELAREGQAAPNGAGGFNGSFANFGPVDSNAVDEVAFIATLDMTANAPNDDVGVFVSDPNTTAQIVRRGDPAPDGNGTFSTFPGSVFINDPGDVVFFAFLEGTASPGNDDHGIFLVDTQLVVHEIARAGQPLEGSTITDIFFLGGPSAGGSADQELAGVDALNNAGEVAFYADLADGRSGIFVPEPSSQLLALTSFAVLAGLRWRGVRSHGT